MTPGFFAAFVNQVLTDLIQPTILLSVIIVLNAVHLRPVFFAAFVNQVEILLYHPPILLFFIRSLNADHLNPVLALAFVNQVEILLYHPPILLFFTRSTNFVQPKDIFVLNHAFKFLYQIAILLLKIIFLIPCQVNLSFVLNQFLILVYNLPIGVSAHLNALKNLVVPLFIAFQRVPNGPKKPSRNPVTNPAIPATAPITPTSKSKDLSTASTPRSPDVFRSSSANLSFSAAHFLASKSNCLANPSAKLICIPASSSKISP